MAEKNVESSRTQGTGTQRQGQALSRQGGEQRQGGTSGALQQRSSAPMVGALGLSPFSLVRRMMEDMERMWEGSGAPTSRGLPNLWSPPLETFERDGRFVARAELPGLAPNDVRVEVQDDALIIEGERKSEIEAEEQGTWRSERTYGHFSRVIPLPDGAEIDKADARFENGVLEVSVPVREDSSRRRRIEVQGASKGGSAVH